MTEIVSEPLVMSDNEGAPEEFAWVAVANASTPAQAEAVANQIMPIGERELCYWCEGRSFHRLKDGDDWQPCAPKERGAIEFWNLEIIEKSDRFDDDTLVIKS